MTRKYVKKLGPDVKVGQIYRDKDPRVGSRLLRVIRAGADHHPATYEYATMENTVTERRSLVRVWRLRTLRLYELQTPAMRKQARAVGEWPASA